MWEARGPERMVEVPSRGAAQVRGGPSERQARGLGERSGVRMPGCVARGRPRWGGEEALNRPSVTYEEPGSTCACLQARPCARGCAERASS